MTRPPLTVAEGFVNSVRHFADRSAIKPLGRPAFTYGELAHQVTRMLLVLRRLNLQVGDRLAVCLPNGAEWAVLTYAAALSGLCIVPINIRYRAQELAYALAHSETKVLFTQQSFMTNGFVDRLREIGEGEIGPAVGVCGIAGLPALNHVILFDEVRTLGATNFSSLVALTEGVDFTWSEAEIMASERTPDEALWLFWTSGSTGVPKGALLSQSAIVNVWKWTSAAGYRADDRVLSSRPLFYIAGHFWCMLGTLLHGACMVVGTQFTPEEIILLCRNEKVTVLSGNPLLLKSVIEHADFESSAFAHVRLGYFGGSSLPLKEIEMIKNAIGYTYLIQTYGMTELGGFATSTLPEDSLEETCATCGLSFTDMALRLVDPNSNDAVPEGAIGKLLTRGQPLLRYVGSDASESRKSISEDGWFDTGDLMRRNAQGRFEFIGRVKDLIKVGGENVTAAEIENKLMEHPDIVLAAVKSRLDPRKGEVPIAFVELAAQALPDPAELRAWCRSRMAPFKVPVDFYFVPHSDWPMTATGKIAKQELRATQ